jgi:hypothetical protein
VRQQRGRHVHRALGSAIFARTGSGDGGGPELLAVAVVSGFDDMQRGPDEGLEGGVAWCGAEESVEDFTREGALGEHERRAWAVREGDGAWVQG